jgi:tRNA pseudouridine synthase 10
MSAPSLAPSSGATPEATPFELEPDVQRVVLAAWDRGLCAECLGRMVGRRGHGLSNPERTERLARALGRPFVPPEGPCRLCEGHFDRWETWVRRCREAAAGWEFRTFTCGSRWEPEILAREESLWTELGAAGSESARSAFNRELGKRLEPVTGASGGTANTDLVFVADLPVGRVELTVHSLYWTGRYRKLDRTLPQTRWPCRRCDGRGCETCGGTGRTYPTSVEELVGGPFVAATEAEGTRFHGMGREDIDARMLGDGRPFVLELLRPRRRTIDLDSVLARVHQEAAGRVEVQEMRPADAAEVRRVKEAAPTKSYRVTVRGAASVENINAALAVVAGRAIAQRTPSRVAHRRSDRVRTRRILEARLVDAAPERFTLELRAEAGTYVKEWVEGDGGRTEPSLSALLGRPVSVEELDVIQIHDRDGS